jgi:hypothetical protein
MPLRYIFVASGAGVALLGGAFWAIDGGSVFSGAIFAVGAVAACAGLIPDLIRLGRELVAIVRSLEIGIDHEVVAENKAAVARTFTSLLRAARLTAVGLIMIAGVVVAVAFLGFAVSKIGDAVSSGGGLIAPRDKQSPGIHRIEVKLGKVIITRKAQGLSHIQIRCNSGLIINADWKLNPLNDFGYDLYEPEVNETTNRMAVMMTTRGVLAAYLRGEYD